MITLHCLPEGESLDFYYYHLVIMYTLLNAQVETIVYFLLYIFYLINLFQYNVDSITFFLKQKIKGNT